MARKMTAVSSFYAWLVKNRHVTENPVAALDRPVVDYDASATPGLTKEQATALLDAADTRSHPDRRAGRHPAVHRGRVSELSARTSPISAPTGATGCCGCAERAARSSPWCCPLRPRTGSTPTWPPARTSPPAAAVVDAPMHPGGCCSPPGPGRGCTGPRRAPCCNASAGRPGCPMTWPSPCPPRSSCATLSLDAGATLRDVQDAMGHADPRTTRRYDRSRGNLDRSPGPLLAGYIGRARLLRWRSPPAVPSMPR